jgi:hypothetical protein
LSAYWLDRHRGWLAARTAGLLIYDDLEQAHAQLESPSANVAVAKEAIESSLQAWDAHREALLYRRGTFPSGVSANQWLDLGAHFRKLKALEEQANPVEYAKTEISSLLAGLATFKEDRYTAPRIVRNALGIALKPRQWLKR